VGLHGKKLYIYFQQTWIFHNGNYFWNIWGISAVVCYIFSIFSKDFQLNGGKYLKKNNNPQLVLRCNYFFGNTFQFKIVIFEPNNFSADLKLRADLFSSVPQLLLLLGECKIVFLLFSVRCLIAFSFLGAFAWLCIFTLTHGAWMEEGVAGSWPVIAIYTGTLAHSHIQILTHTSSEDPGAGTNTRTHAQLCLCAWFDGDSRPGQKPNQSQQQTNKYKHKERRTHTHTHTEIVTNTKKTRERAGSVHVCMQNFAMV